MTQEPSMTLPTVSYAQRFEDLYLLRAFGERASGFYIDIGSGHPVYDNMSLAFYLKGWRGVTVEPNPWLAQLTRAVRPRDQHVEAVIGARAGQASFHIVREFHGLSTTIADHAAISFDSCASITPCSFHSRPRLTPSTGTWR